MVRDKKTTRKIMSSIRSRNTEPEILLGKALWALGLRYRKHYKITGKPDFALVRARIAVFCDGDFWHGNNWRLRKLKNRKEELASYNAFWKEKITGNIERDKKVNRELKNHGWAVIRFWESHIRKSPLKCAEKVAQIFHERRGE
ncbi:MAG TPA: very short patch repair endonuclease [Spirochaetia bacterium]|nr:very short patch repair endonuclease [Spirochaetia bacterium]